jgi:hypothetical protein
MTKIYPKVSLLKIVHFIVTVVTHDAVSFDVCLFLFWTNLLVHALINALNMLSDPNACALDGLHPLLYRPEKSECSAIYFKFDMQDVGMKIVPLE